MELYLNIAGMNIKISGYPYEKPSDRLIPFLFSFKEEQADIIYNVCIYEGEFKVNGELVIKANLNEIYRDNNQYTLAFSFSNITEKTKCYTIFNYGDKNVKIWINKQFLNFYNNQELFLSLLAFDFAVIPYRRMMMHASVVAYKSRGILFTGPSGIGKSTQSELWKKYKNADILNGDRAALDIGGESVRAYGSPYAGSSDIYRNCSVPVKAIVMLAQSKINSIELLHGANAYKTLLPRMSVIRWDKMMISESMELVWNVVEKVPIYRLSCYPGEEAVNLLYKTIFSNKEI